LSDKAASSVRIMSGNEACAEGALAAGLRFYAGYPITPSSEIAEELAVALPKVGGVFIQMEDEIAAMGAVVGASLTGLKAMTATSGPGFSLKQENLGFACMVEAPCVIVDVMRGGPSTGLPTGPSQSDVMQARWGTHGDHPVIALTPDSVQEIFTETVRAFSLSERFRTPVILLTDEIIGHMREKIVLPPPGGIPLWDRPRPSAPPASYRPFAAGDGLVPPMADFGTGYRFHVTGLNHDEGGFPTHDPRVVQAEEARMLDKVLRNLPLIEKYEHREVPGAKVGIVAYGSTSRSSRSAAAQAGACGVPCDLLRPVTMWPFPEEPLRRMAQKVDVIIVPEMNLGQVIHEVERVVCGEARVVGVNQVDGEPITPARILGMIREVAR
jgi:2-oxoglutarate/2-oxoacid ferredoxin oxidoreductase subunit alpha